MEEEMDKEGKERGRKEEDGRRGRERKGIGDGRKGRKKEEEEDERKRWK